MATPLIILGAGASHDFTHPSHLGVSSHRERVTFPITNDLVSLVDTEIEARYSGFKTMRSLITSSILSGRKSFEECVENWGDYEQRIALLLYLGDYFYKKSNDKQIEGLPNNFLALIDLIRKSTAKEVNFVTFNYDLLLEKAIDPTLQKFFNLPDYISDQIRIIKIHGSCDWYSLMSQVSDNIYSALKQHSEFFSKPNREILTKRWLNQKNSGANQYFHVPVISIPTTSTKSYSCPMGAYKVLGR
ncbi:MAG: hypothetical protein Q8Q95_00720 [bacterium]|nr:hypothetical protein [bacterium]